MASWVFCNRCFQPPQGTACFSLTNCGHVYCDVCLRKGKRDECLICKVPCRAVLLSKRTDSDIQALFMGIDGLCRKYARETSQVLEFQEKHRRRLLAFYGEKCEIVTTDGFQHKEKSSFKFLATAPSTKPNGPLFLPPGSSASARVESMEVDLTPSPRRKREAATGLTRISLLSPPRDGRMDQERRQKHTRPSRLSGFWAHVFLWNRVLVGGCSFQTQVPLPVGPSPAGSPPAVLFPPALTPNAKAQEHRPRGRFLGAARASCGARGRCPQDRDPPWPMVLRQDLKDPLLKAWHPLFLWPDVAHRPQHLGLTPRHPSEPQALRIPALQTPWEWPSQSPAPQAAGRAGTGAAPRQPLSISGLLQRRHLGSAGRGGLVHEH
ncbi:hypothetical protein EI555_012647 [Monodon monoceros]|uniref:Probable E3 SUMO-protein ligase RNF212 n=1 Tax=Monodon monoceros TaxID=40151 RepID=A0A4U1EVW4_MONMO|nr:hypothetical protein EI555_012647 [Monodon monoceros]